jgi:hypothetical protein
MLAIHFFGLWLGTERRNEDENETVVVNGNRGVGFEFRCL